MSLNTNGWDFGYHMTLDNLNSIIKGISGTLPTETPLNNGSDNDAMSLIKATDIPTSVTKASILDADVHAFIKQVFDILIKKVPLYKDYKNDYFPAFVAKSSAFDYFDYLLEEILKKFHEVSKEREIKERAFLKKTINKESLFNGTKFFDDKIEVELIKKRARIYLGYDHTLLFYDVLNTTAIPLEIPYASLFNQTREKLIDIIVSFVQAFVPVLYIDKAVIFGFKSLGFKTYITKLRGLSKFRFILGGNASTALIEFNTEFEFQDNSGANKITDLKNKANVSLTLLNNKLTFSTYLNFNWVANTYDTTTPTEPSFLGSSSKPDLDLTPSDNESLILINCIYKYINESQISATLAANYKSVTNYHRYYYAFAQFNKVYDMVFKDINNFDWLFPTTVRYAIQDGSYDPTKLDQSVFSICCMINGKANKRPGTADLNAIPEDATSALVIERSVFGEHMVMPVIANNNINDNVNYKTTKFNKSSQYSFENNLSCTLKYSDFEKPWEPFTFVPILPLIKKIKPIKVLGVISQGALTISINDDHITVKIQDVKYDYSIENEPKFTQEYKCNIKYEKKSYKLTFDKMEVSVNLSTKDIEYFHNDFISQGWYMIYQGVVGSVKSYKKLNKFKLKEREDKLSRHFPLLLSDEREQFRAILLDYMEDVEVPQQRRLAILDNVVPLIEENELIHNQNGINENFEWIKQIILDELNYRLDPEPEPLPNPDPSDKFLNKFLRRTSQAWRSIWKFQKRATKNPGQRVEKMENLDMSEMIKLSDRSRDLYNN